MSDFYFWTGLIILFAEGEKSWESQNDKVSEGHGSQKTFWGYDNRSLHIVRGAGGVLYIHWLSWEVFSFWSGRKLDENDFCTLTSLQ